MKMFKLLVLPVLFSAAAYAEYPGGEFMAGQPRMRFAPASGQPITENLSDKNALIIEIANPEAVKYATTTQQHWPNGFSQPKEMASYIGEPSELNISNLIRRTVSITFGKFVKFEVDFHVFNTIKNLFTRYDRGEHTVSFVMLRNSELIEASCHVETSRLAIHLGPCKTSEDRKIEFAGPVGDYLYSPRTECGTYTKIAFDQQSLIELKKKK